MGEEGNASLNIEQKHFRAELMWFLNKRDLYKQKAKLMDS
jgi:uncharacterized protein (DUF2461 family)